MPETSKAILLVCDGLGDRPLSALGGFTPLESARKPAWNVLAERGISGMLDPIDVGVRPGSDVAVLSLLGFDPKVNYPGRGPLEALGEGITLKPGDIAFRTNFATRNSVGRILDRRAGRIKDTQELEHLLNKISLTTEVKATFKSGVEHRGVLVLRGKGLGTKVSDIEVQETTQKLTKSLPLDSSETAKLTADSVNEYLVKANDSLEKAAFNKKRVSQKLLPANTLTLRGAGTLPNLPSFESKWGLKAACVAGGRLEKGIAQAAGMQQIAVKGATGRSDTDLMGKFTAAKNAIESGTDFVFVHVKAADSFGHDGDFEGKKNFIQRIDAAMSLWLEMHDVLIVTTADHSTPCELKRHSGDPVPVMFCGHGVRKDSVRQFGERESARGALGRIRGLSLMSEIANLCGKAPLFGA